MLRNVEQAMWYINMAAAAVLFARLYAQGLVRAYPFLFAYLFADTSNQSLCWHSPRTVTSTRRFIS